jgi:hypothetical protein
MGAMARKNNEYIDFQLDPSQCVNEAKSKDNAEAYAMFGLSIGAEKRYFKEIIVSCLSCYFTMFTQLEMIIKATAPCSN